jgi:hypothetical protein
MGSGGSGHDMSSMNDMPNMMALQATDEQKSQFHTWNQSTEAVKQQLEGTRRATAGGNDSGHLDTLKAAIDKSNDAHHLFVSSLTPEQQSGLKKPLQQLGKANNELNKAMADISHDLGPSSTAKRAPKLDKLEKTVGKLLQEQKAIAKQMGIA